MALYSVSFMSLHSPLFMQGSNLGDKITAAHKNAQFAFDDVSSVIWVHFKNKVTPVPLSNVASFDMADIPGAVKDFFSIGAPPVIAVQSLPPTIAAARRGRPPKNHSLPNLQIPTTGLGMESFINQIDPNDPEDAAAHRARVRAASANSNRPEPSIQNDLLVQEARAQAIGMKTSAQVSNPTKPTEGLTGVSGKPKALSHTQLKKQVAAEMKTQA